MSQTPTTSLVVSVAMDTHIGRKRQQNQDAIGHLVPTDPVVLDELGQIFVLADGVGGLKGGDLASQYAVSTIIASYYEQPEGDPSDRLARAIAEANNVIHDEGQSQETPHHDGDDGGGGGGAGQRSDYRQRGGQPGVPDP